MLGPLNAMPQHHTDRDPYNSIYVYLTVVADTPATNVNPLAI